MKHQLLIIILTLCGIIVQCPALATSLEWSAQMHVSPHLLTSDGFDVIQPEFHIIVKNTGNQAWDTKNERLFISYHVYNQKNILVKYDNIRFAVPDLKSLQEVSLNIPIPNNFPSDLKKKYIYFDLVREGVAWFSQKNLRNKFPKVTVIKTDITLESLRKKPELWKARSLTVGIRDIDLATSLAFYTIEKSKRNFVTPAGNFVVLDAGAGYAQAWIRDCASGVKAAFLVIGDSAARGCASLHMLKQRDDGYVNDWVDAKGIDDKNTVESDQESSLVIAVSDYINVSHNHEFMKQKIGNKTVIERLGMALNFVWLTKRDVGTGLIRSGHTIDWGDVSIDDSDEKAKYLKITSHFVVGIYTNSMYVIAINDYINLISKSTIKKYKETKIWQGRLKGLKRDIIAQLWSPENGYFIMHKDITPINISANEKSMFAMGGNAVAIEAGITNPEMTNRIVEKALNMQKIFKSPTISGVLYPPFADGVYKNSAVSVEFKYQNGGLWDWFGLRLVSAMFETDHAKAACYALSEIASKVVRNRTFSEWDGRDGQAMGSKDYLGAAAEYITAVQNLRSRKTFVPNKRIPLLRAEALCTTLD